MKIKHLIKILKTLDPNSIIEIAMETYIDSSDTVGGWDFRDLDYVSKSKKTGNIIFTNERIGFPENSANFDIIES
jgi:hypothetical protein